MRYLLLNDLNYLVRFQKKIFITYLLVPLIYLSFLLAVNIEINLELFNKILGINADFISFDWLSILLYIFYLSIFLYLAVTLFILDMKSGAENLFLRMSYKKWLFYKLLVIGTTLLLMLISLYLVLGTIFSLIINNFELKIMINTFFKNFSYILVIQSAFLMLYSLYFKFKIIIFIIISLLIVNFYKFPTIIEKTNIFVNVSIYFVIFIMFIYLFKYLYINMFEKK